MSRGTTRGIVAVEPVADGRQLFAVGLGDIEDRHVLEATDDSIVVAVLGVGLLVDHRRQDPDRLLALADEAAQLVPGVEACHPCRLGHCAAMRRTLPKL